MKNNKKKRKIKVPAAKFGLGNNQQSIYPDYAANFQNQAQYDNASRQLKLDMLNRNPLGAQNYFNNLDNTIEGKALAESGVSKGAGKSGSNLGKTLGSVGAGLLNNADQALDLLTNPFTTSTATTGKEAAMQSIANVGKGAAMGMQIAGPWGALAGAAIGAIGSKGEEAEMTSFTDYDEGTLGTGLIGAFTNKKLRRERERIKMNANKNRDAVRGTEYLANEYEMEHGDLDTNSFAFGGNSNSLAYVDDGELINTPDGSMTAIPEEGKPVDSNLVSLPEGSRILSNTLKVPGTGKTFAEEGKRIMKRKKNINKDIYAQNADKLNTLNEQQAFDDLYQLQEEVKAKKGIKPKSKGIPAYEGGTDGLGYYDINGIKRPIKKWGDNLEIHEDGSITYYTDPMHDHDYITNGGIVYIDGVPHKADKIRNFYSESNSRSVNPRRSKVTLIPTEIPTDQSTNTTNAQPVSTIEAYPWSSALSIPTWSGSTKYNDAEPRILDGGVLNEVVITPEDNIKMTSYSNQTTVKPRTTQGAKTSTTAAKPKLNIPKLTKDNMAGLNIPQASSYPTPTREDMVPLPPRTNNNTSDNNTDKGSEYANIPELTSDTNWIGLLPILDNLFSNTPEIARAVYNPYSNSILNAMRGRRFDVTSALNDIRQNRAISNYNADQMNTNTGANLAYRIASQRATDDAIQALRTQENNVNNAYLADYANVANNLGQQYVGATNLAADINRRNRATARNIRRAGLSQLSQWGQNEKLMRNQVSRDNAMLRLYAPLLQGGFTTDTYNNFMNYIGDRLWR